MSVMFLLLMSGFLLFPSVLLTAVCGSGPHKMVVLSVNVSQGCGLDLRHLLLGFANTPSVWKLFSFFFPSLLSSSFLPFISLSAFIFFLNNILSNCPSSKQ